MQAGRTDFKWSDLFYQSNALDGGVLRTNYDPKGPLGEDIYDAINLWKNATWKGKGIGIVLANSSSNPFASEVKLRYVTDPEAKKEVGIAAYRKSTKTIEINEEKIMKYSPRERKGIIAHELGHAMGLAHGCKNTLMQGNNGDPGVDLGNPWTPTGFDVWIMQRVR